jgi:puromycin-sensitive aminopeptidase
MPATEYLDLTTRFSAETDRNVWTVLAGSFAFVARVVAPELRRGLAALIRHRAGSSMERLGWEPQPDESELQRQLRGDLVRLIGTLGEDPAMQERAREAYARYRDNDLAVDPNVLPALIAIVAWTGGEEEYAGFLDRFKHARTPQDEQRYLYALAGFRQPELLSRTLELTLNGEVRSQDAPFLVRTLLSSLYGRGLAWDFVKRHWEAMARHYPGSAYRRMWEGITGLVSAEWEREVHAFFNSTQIVLGGKTLAQYLEQLRVAVSFQERETTALTTYLSRIKR